MWYRTNLNLEEYLINLLAKVTTSNPEIEQEEFKKVQLDVVQKAIEDKKITEEDFSKFITSDTDNGKFLRELIEEGILSHESVEVMEEEVKDLVLEGVI